MARSWTHLSATTWKPKIGSGRRVASLLDFRKRSEAADPAISFRDRAACQMDWTLTKRMPSPSGGSKRFGKRQKNCRFHLERGLGAEIARLSRALPRFLVASLPDRSHALRKD